jgi:hypothetical protein
MREKSATMTAAEYRLKAMSEVSAALASRADILEYRQRLKAQKIKPPEPKVVHKEEAPKPKPKKVQLRKVDDAGNNRR